MLWAAASGSGHTNKALLYKLTNLENPENSLCVITSRHRIAGLGSRPDSKVKVIDMKDLDEASGCELLGSFDVIELTGKLILEGTKSEGAAETHREAI